MIEGFGGDRSQRGLSQPEMAALSLIDRYRRNVAETFPKIQDDFRNGMTHSEIAKKYDIVGVYNVTEEIAKSIIRAALLELIDKEEYDRIVEEHSYEKGLRGDVTNKKQGTGIYAISKEGKIEAARKGGMKTFDLGVGLHAISRNERSEIGRETYRRGVGIHGQTKEQLSEIAKRNKEKGLGIFGMTKEQRRERVEETLRQTGKDIWNGGVFEPITGLDEGDYCMFLSRNPDFQFSSGQHAGRPDRQKIALELNRIFPATENSYKSKDRTSNAVGTYINRHKKS